MQKTTTLRLIQLAGFSCALILGGTRTPLQPEQHVYPDSTLEEIQAAIDNGGTVYFEFLTRQSRKYGEYNQIASASPDLPPSAANLLKGFNVGMKGRDVDIIGILGDNGERPRINGGTIPFRIGSFPGFGLNGPPVNFRIENLELYNPDMQTLNWRIGIWVLNGLAERSVINNCKITVTVKDSDPGAATNHGVAIWVYLGAGGNPRPPTGARIDVTNNIVNVVGTHEAIHVDSFWPETAGFVAPRAFVSNNTVTVAHIGGYPNKSGTNGASLATAILLAGNLSNSIVSNNVVRGDGRSPGRTPPVETVGLGLYPANATGDALDNVAVVGNDLSLFHGDYQIWVQTVASGATIARNALGAADVAGVRCLGEGNWFLWNHFYGPYFGFASASGGPGLFWFTNGSRDNRVESTMLNGTLTPVDICGQTRDESGGVNKIAPGGCAPR